MKPMSSKDLDRALRTGLRVLRMPGIREWYREIAEVARKESLSFERFLLMLVEQEQQNRTSNRNKRTLRASQLPLAKTLDRFDRTRLPIQINHQLSSLLEGRFLDSKENVIALGPPGSGKTHLVCALGNELIHRGRRIRFYRSSELIEELVQAKQKQCLLATQYRDHEPPGLLPVGADLPDLHHDNRGAGSFGAPQCDPGTGPAQLPAGSCTKEPTGWRTSGADREGIWRESWINGEREMNPVKGPREKRDRETLRRTSPPAQAPQNHAHRRSVPSPAMERNPGARRYVGRDPPYPNFNCRHTVILTVARYAICIASSMRLIQQIPPTGTRTCSPKEPVC